MHSVVMFAGRLTKAARNEFIHICRYIDGVYRITTRWSDRDLVSTRIAPLPVQPTWHCRAPTRSCPPSNSARKWRSWLRLKKNSRY